MYPAKYVAILILIAATAGALYLACYEPYRCSVIMKEAQISTETLFATQETMHTARAARRNIGRLSACQRCCFREVDLYMIRAANYRLLKSLDEAIREYETALRYDRRPEIYLNLGETLMQSGRRDEGIRQIVIALEFDPSLFEVALSPNVKVIVGPAYKKILARDR